MCSVAPRNGKPSPIASTIGSRAKRLLQWFIEFSYQCRRVPPSKINGSRLRFARRSIEIQLDGNKNESNDDMYRQQVQIFRVSMEQSISFAIPRHVVQQRFRPPKKNVPQTPA